jgi:hypothetical protein
LQQSAIATAAPESMWCADPAHSHLLTQPGSAINQLGNFNSDIDQILLDQPFLDSNAGESFLHHSFPEHTTSTPFSILNGSLDLTSERWEPGQANTVAHPFSATDLASFNIKGTQAVTSAPAGYQILLLAPENVKDLSETLQLTKEKLDAHKRNRSRKANQLQDTDEDFDPSADERHDADAMKQTVQKGRRSGTSALAQPLFLHPGKRSYAQIAKIL